MSRASLLLAWSTLGSAVLLLAPLSSAADPPAVAEIPKGAANRVAGVTVYPNSALVTREVDVPAGPGQMELVVPALPPMTVGGSLYSEGGEGVRVLQTRFRSRQVVADTRADVRQIEEELKALQSARDKLASDILAVQENLKLLSKLENYTAVTTVSATEKAALNSEAAIALANYVMENRTKRHDALVALDKLVKQNHEQAEFAKRKLVELSAGASRTEYDAVIVVEKAGAAAGKVRLNYLVEAATWRPQYKLRAGKAAGDAVQVEYLAAVVQQTGESWDNVALVLSTAQPALHAAPPDLQALHVVVQHAGAPVFNAMDLQNQARTLRTQAMRDFSKKNPLGGSQLCNTAAALDQCWELLVPNPADGRVACASASREGPSVAYALPQRLSVPSRKDEQVVEIARLDLSPDYYHKAVPVLTPHVYRLADLTNKSNYILLPGEANMHVGSDFVGQVNLPLVAIGEQFTVGFGVDPQVQVERQLANKSRAIQGGNQVLSFEYRFLVQSYKTQRIKLLLLDRLPFAEAENVGVSLLRTSPAMSTDPLYLRTERPKNLLRWDLTVEPGMTGEKSLAVNYEFRLELDRQLTLGGFQSGMAQAAPPPRKIDDPKVLAALAQLSPEDRVLAEAQVFCAIKEEARLGSVGVIQKVMVKDRPVFVCCGGCASRAQANPDETLARVDRLMAQARSGGAR